ncbi:MAG TPA: plasmid stabilization protein [Verrucomicrobia bacterium]|nr:plasmid stabilization protein [Verrucomicrobiota bacterium]
MVQLTWTQTFTRTARRLLRKNPTLQSEFQTVLEQLETDPAHPRLRLHPLKGRLQGKHAVSLTYSHRIILLLALDQGRITLLDVGTEESEACP